MNRFERQLFSRYQNIIDLANPSSNSSAAASARRDGDIIDQHAIAERNQAAYNSLRMEMETAALVKTCEDILTMSRQMKELWLFGKLNTLSDGKGDVGVEEKLEEDGREVGRLMEALLTRSDSGL